jgi:hypothetical protein
MKCNRCIDSTMMKIFDSAVMVLILPIMMIGMLIILVMLVWLLSVARRTRRIDDSHAGCR